MACGEGDADNKRTDRTPAAAALRDAGARIVANKRPRDAAPRPKSSGFHLDPVSVGDSGVPIRRRRRGKRTRPIKLTLRSTPSGARVLIDNKAIGVTPTFYELQTSGTPHRFTFLLEGYAMETYRFVPITDGVVHGTLTKLVKSQRDAGAAKP